VKSAPLIACLALVTANLPATAEDPRGLWGFRTDIAQKGCRIEGQMSIDPQVPGEAARNCRFISAETCGQADPEPTRMEQACRVLEQGRFLLIRSEVIASLTEAVPADYYLPDHFTVKPTEPGRMAGTWHDRNYRDSVEFWRIKTAPSS
jgi:hypothetical protein